MLTLYTLVQGPVRRTRTHWKEWLILDADGHLVSWSRSLRGAILQVATLWWFELLAKEDP